MPRILIAGIGNLLLGDDGFGCEVARRLVRRGLAPEVHCVDFGIRGFDLAYALMEDYEVAILVDATARGGPPGTLYVLEPLPDEFAPDAQATLQAHALNPMQVLQWVQTCGGSLPRLRLVGCEPLLFGSAEEPVMGLSAIVQSAVEEAIGLIDGLVSETLARPRQITPLHGSRLSNRCMS